jgi:hypothetical protein
MEVITADDFLVSSPRPDTQEPHLRNSPVPTNGTDPSLTQLSSIETGRAQFPALPKVAIAGCS